ncbi:zinc-dependent alcohol dehydrogenase family protein [Siminovitchia fortis]|uniref:Alcohol dehydrogenase n=1 Tax=Siminovitchia fortis TaxID=254758 RepID=A0A443IK83_9BACI|nr:zinc-dependent alcohol dehydrogenase family protein [Siminovitchia fortis]RWR04917.1 alcohol dehydrogenase [Siminovitchia fortis]WHY82553.1 zinc-dependent alcohol dehydrogenase family protein [Siminovitchia fortis]
MKAKCIKFYEFGSPEDVLTIEYKSVQPPADHEILVRMLVRPINPSDLIPIRGSYAHRTSLPAIPGYEGVGIVEDVGSLVTKNLIGKRVLPFRGEGTWQEFVKTSAEHAILIPDFIDDFIAAQMYINPITAWVICTEKLRLGPGDTLLVNACGSSIGHIFAQLSKVLGFRLIAVTRNDHYTDELLRLGASHVVNTSKDPLYETVMDLTNGRRASAAIDSVGGQSGTELAYCVNPRGTLLSIGLLSGTQVNWEEVTKKAMVNAQIFHLRHWNQRVSTETWQGTFQRLIELIKNNQLSLMKPASHFDLSEIKEAVKSVESLKTRRGKVLLTSYLN